MDSSSSAEHGILPGWPVLLLCALILFISYVAAILRPADRSTTASKVPPAVPVTEAAEP